MSEAVADVVVEDVKPVSESEEQTENTAENPPAEPEKKPEDNSVIRQMRNQIRRLERQLKDAASTPKPAPEPVRENFEDDASYTKALVDHRVNECLEQRVQPQRVIPSFESARKVHEDYDDVINNTPVDFDKEQGPIFTQAITNLSHGGELLYKIAKDDDLRAELELLPPAALAARLGEIHAEIKAEKKKPAAAKATSAKPPIEPVTPRGGSATVDTSKMSDAEYMAYRRERILKKR